MITVKATREGLLGHKTATDDVLDRRRPIVALPSVKALDKFVKVYNPLTGRTMFALVDDVGPFNEHDDAYVFQPATQAGAPDVSETVRPQSESGISVSGAGTNHSGIDLGEVLWTGLGMTDNTEVQWEFAE